MTIPKECKRLAEVDFPIAEVSKHAVREKSIRHGHPSTLHLWWARRPLASSRAMLMALLLPDPVDPHCPPEFREQARAVLLAHHGRPSGWTSLVADDEGLRQALLRFIGDFANWQLAADPHWLKTARNLVKAAHPDETPLVVDPFAGGGSIPLEALRLGCDAFASDLNPVAVLINKVMLEDIPRYGKAKIRVTNAEGMEVEVEGLAEALRIAGAAVKTTAEKELAEFYPLDADGSRPIAYIWARTVRCEAPNCGAEIPLLRSFWLARKPNRKYALRYSIKRSEGVPPHLQYEIFEPTSERQVPRGTVNRARATCPCCNMVLAPDRVRTQLTEQNGGADIIVDGTGNRVGGAMLLAVVLSRPSEKNKSYRLPCDRDNLILSETRRELDKAIELRTPSGLESVPSEPTPSGGGSGAGRAFSVQKYGMMQWRDLFNTRQLLMLLHLVSVASEQYSSQPALHRLLSLAITRFIDDYSSLCRWMDRETPSPTFARNALPIIWDYCEIYPFDDASWSLAGSIEWVAKAVDKLPSENIGQVQQADACVQTLPSESTACWFTDPPYYDAIPYSDMSDFFFVWLKRLLRNTEHFRDPFDSTNDLTPKDREAVQDDNRIVNGTPKDKAFFEESMRRAFVRGRSELRDDGIGCVVFAHKTTEGWEALLSGMIQAGWTVTGSWPIATERPGRLRSLDSAALATSIHLVCRPRPEDAISGDWGNVLSDLPRVVKKWMSRLESEGIRGADLVFACIGPALELYSQYSEVVDAEDRLIPLGGDPAASEPYRRGYLAYVWETVARLALEQVLGTSDGGMDNANLEEDARLTALFLWTLQSTDGEEESGPSDKSSDTEEDDDDEEESSGSRRKPKGLSLPFDVARRFAQPLGIHLDQWQERIITIDKGVVRLLPVGERARQLFGPDGAEAVAGELERSPLKARDLQLGLFAELPEPAKPARGRRRNAVDVDALNAAPDSTTLDRVHAAMLLQKSGRTQALRALLAAEQEQGPAFLRLANALSGLYPRGSEEKRLVDAMLLAYPK